jgi:hypothetical protein
MRTYLGVTLVAAATSLVNVSCQQVECGIGTVERDGVCLPADESTDPGNCGGDGPFATVLGLDGKCETEVPTVCDEDSTREEVDMQTGIVTCIGTGGGCPSEIDCEAPDAGKATLCGRIWDAETDLPITMAAGANGMMCNPAAPTTDGPCSLRLRFFDALDFAMNPGGAMPIVPEGGVYTDDCNRYRGHNMTRATFGFIGIAVDDAPGITPTTPHRLTGVATSNALAAPGAGFRAYSTRVSTDMAWTTGSGIGGGMTFAQRGVLAIVFHYQGMPRAGVRIRRNSQFIAADDFYFADTGITRSMAVPQVNTMDPTGPNGTGLVINSPTPIEHDGQGAEPSGCRWPANLAASIPGVVFMQIKDAETPAGAACP